MPKEKQKSKPLPDRTYAPTITTHSVRARVKTFDARRGSGTAITAEGRRVRIPLSALNAANIPVLAIGDELLLQLDHLDKGRAESIRLVD